MSKKILTDDLVYEKMNEDGIKEELYGEDAKKHMLNEWDASFDIDTGFSNGHEDIIIYTETSADGYSVYICTDNHNGRININDDLYYYVNGESFMERTLETLRYGGFVWMDSDIADDISTEIDEAFAVAYEEWYEGKFEEYQNELIDDGYDLEEKK